MNILLDHVAKDEMNTSTLEYVDLDENLSSPWGVYCAIIKHSSVKSLTLCGDNGLETYVEQLTSCLEESTQLKTLTLCNFGKIGVGSIKKVLVSNKTLYEVNLSYKKFKCSLKAKSDVILSTEYVVDEQRIDSYKIYVNIWWNSHIKWSPNTIEIPGHYDQ